MKRVVLMLLGLLALAVVPRGSKTSGVRVASKAFTESVILGEILTQSIRSTGQPVTHFQQLGGTRIVYDALKRGEIDIYPEYTGTILQEILSDELELSPDKLSERLKADGILTSTSLGFSNNYALAVRRDTAEELKLSKISDLASHPDLKLGFGNEFLDREDGWKNLRTRYSLPHQNVSGMEHDVAYRQLDSQVIDVVDVYTTDAQIAELELVVLEDDLGYFPQYEAVILYRADLEDRAPQAVEQIKALEAAIDTETIIGLNAEVGSRSVSEMRAASGFLHERFALNTQVEDLSTATRIWHRTLEHIDLVRRSLIPAIFAAIPLGIVAAKFPRFGQIVLGLVGVVQTIPALALLVLLIAPIAAMKLDTLGAGSATAIAALFLYSLLPIVRNTATGLSSISHEYTESATALGLSKWFRLLHIELPLASPSILAGIKTAAVLNVGFATLGALVGARGYGQPILTGIRLNDTGLIMQGAVPAACLAIVLQIFFEVAERWFVPAGLRPVRPEASTGDSNESSH